MYLIPMANFRSLQWAFVIEDFGSLKGFREICLLFSKIYMLFS